MINTFSIFNPDSLCCIKFINQHLANTFWDAKKRSIDWATVEKFYQYQDNIKLKTGN